MDSSDALHHDRLRSAYKRIRWGASGWWEKDYDALRQNQGILAKTAEALHLPKKTLYDKLRKHRIEPVRE